MGAAYTCSTNNENLVDNLRHQKFITSKQVERVFRAVDRGDYIWPSQKDHAYKDISSKCGNIHLSAPCIYARAMEALTLEPGMSFLNIGSGTGYFSTMAGLILGDKGTNHGIEMHEDCLNYALDHLEEFKAKSQHVDVFEFCEPVFQLGNFLNVMPSRQYDRVYCGAACPEEHEKFVKRFVKIGGILIVPYKDQLLRITRTGEKSWNTQFILSVSFATLMSPEEGSDKSLIQLPLWNPTSLQELCRNLIRSHLRKMVWAENSDLEDKRPTSNWVDHYPCEGETDSLAVEVLREISQFIRTSPIPPVYAGNERLSFYINRGMSENGSDSEDDLESQIERFFGCQAQEAGRNGGNKGPLRRSAWENANRGRPVEQEESDEWMDMSSEESEAPGEIEDVEMDERNENGAAEGSTSNSSDQSNSGSNNLKRKMFSSSDSDEDGSSDECDNDDLLNVLLINQVFTVKHKNCAHSQSFNAKDDESSDENKEAARSCTMTFKCSESEKTTGNEATSSKISPGDGDEPVAGESSSGVENGEKAKPCVTPDGSKVESEARDEDSNDKNEPDKKDHSDTSSNEEMDDRENCRRDYRVGQKRRSERKSGSSESNGPLIKGKRSFRSKSVTPNGTKSSRSSKNRTKRSPSRSSISSENSADPFSSDTDSDANAEAKRTYVYTIRNDLFTSYMKKKIHLLPLPPTLRMYINYNREL